MIGNLKYLSAAGNVLENAVITATTVDSEYPVENLTDLTSVARTTRTTAVDAQQWAADLGAVKAFNEILVANHNFSPTADVRLRAGSAPNPDGGQFEVSLDWRKGDMFVAFEEESWRYVALYVDDPDNTDGYLESGGVLLGVAAEVPHNPQWQHEVGHETKNNRQITAGGVRHSVTQYKFKTFSMSFAGFDQEEADEVVEVLDSLDMDVTPIFIVPYPEDRYEGWLMQLVSPLVEQRKQWVDVPTLRFEELSRGLVAA